MHQEMMEHKGKAVELQEEKDRWEAEWNELISQIASMKRDQNDEKEIMEELMNQTPTDEDLSIVNIEKPLNDFSMDDLLVPMSQDRNQLQKKFNELKERNIRNCPLQGEKHIIWDTLSVEITKLRHYLNFIDDQSILINLAHQRLKLVNENMERKPLATAQNTLNFLNSLTYQKLHDMDKGQNINSTIG